MSKDQTSDGPDTDKKTSDGADVERARTLREIGDDIREESSESKMVAAMLYRISDLYDPNEETSPRDIYVSMREIIRTKDS